MNFLKVELCTGREMGPNDLKVFVLTFNRPTMLARQLDSLLAQTVRPDVITVLDNGINPATRQIVESRYAKGARYVNTHELGVSGNGIMAKRLCGREGYVALFHDDDMVSPRYFEYVLGVIKNYPDIALVVGDAEVQPAAELKVSLSTPHGRGLILNVHDWALHMFCCKTLKYPFAFYRADLYDSIDNVAISSEFGRVGDIPLLLRAVGQCGKAALLTFPFCSYGEHLGQDSHNSDTMPSAFEMARFYAEFHKYLGDDLATIAGFLYVFKCRRVLRSAYKRRCRKDVPYAQYLSYAKSIGALPLKSCLFGWLSNHFTQRLLSNFVSFRFKLLQKDLLPMEES